MKVVFRVDSSETIGAGHLIRCITLAEELIKRGANIQFICREHIGNLIFLLNEKKIPTTILPSEKSRDNLHGLYNEWLDIGEDLDAEQTVKAIGEEMPNWLIVDHYGIREHWQIALKKFTEKLLVIDDLIDSPQYGDAILNQNYVCDAAVKYQGLVPESCDLLVGTEYSLLKSEYREIRKKQPKKVNAVDRILIFFTAGDDAGETLKAMQGVAQYDSSKHVDVVVGLNNQYRQEIEDYCKQKKWFYHCQIDYMHELIGDATIVIGACGASTWERCALGAVTIATILAENQRKVAEELSGKNVLQCLGWFEDLTSDSYFHAINALTPEKMEELRCNSLLLVDAEGVSRVSDYLFSKAP